MSAFHSHYSRRAFLGAGLAAAALPAKPAEIGTTHFNFAPQERNAPKGVARGIDPGRVVWARNPDATKWAGRWKLDSDQWWTDVNTDQDKVGAMLSACLRKLTSTATDEDAWRAIFDYYHQRARGIGNRGVRAGEIVAIKANFNVSHTTKINNLVDVSPQMVLAMVRQLVFHARVAPADILVYDARRAIAPIVLTKVWGEFKDVRFVQQDPPDGKQPRNPGYGDHHGLEGADWVEGVTYSAGQYKNARLMPRQVMAATYLINMALVKAQSYPWNFMEGGEEARLGDQGQTGVSMTGKNHFGSILGTREMHDTIDTNVLAKGRTYSPMVDLAAAPNLGAKTVLFVLDGLYCARKHESYPLHFPNAPFHNRVTPYENPDWPASILASLDGVALDSVGVDILHSQTVNNGDPRDHNRPRILLREYTDDYLHEMALAGNPPSGTLYTQGGRRVNSLGVFEHWDDDATRRYSRNLDREHGQGIELLYLPMTAAPVEPPAIFTAPGPKASLRKITLRCATRGARIYYTTDGSVPTDRSTRYTGPARVFAKATVRAVAMTDDLPDSRIVTRSAG
ncbi:MAG: chitobiase/beta-hexosaminidase C-terminal domain-containing protein [Bryobacteraceae bacterium]